MGFSGSRLTGPIINPNVPHSDVPIGNGIVGGIGPEQIARSQALSKNKPELSLKTAPRYVQVVNRAQRGNVKVWFGTFDGRFFPDGADELDKSTWLQPGQAMHISTEEAIFFFGNFFHPSPPLDSILAVIERFGGFQLDAKVQYQRLEKPRIIGGPIGLPDVILQPMDSRMRAIGEAYPLYDRYDAATKHLHMRSINKDEDLRRQEAELLLARIEEYRDTDRAIYDVNGKELAVATDCDCSPIAHERGVVGCAHNPLTARAAIIAGPKPPIRDPDDPEQTHPMEPDPEPEDTKPPGGQTRRR